MARLNNHMHKSLAIDFAVVPTTTFQIICVFFVLSVDRRHILHLNVTKHPTAKWTAHLTTRESSSRAQGWVA